MPRIKRTVFFSVVLAGALIALVTVALASSPKPGAQFTGETGHHKYVLTLYAECFTNGCKRTTTIGVQVTTGKASKPNGKCVYGTWQLGDAKLKKHKFTSRGDVTDHGKDHLVKVTGTFTSATKVHGKVFGPKICGGTSSYTLHATKAG